ncbi:MAG: hypothetical protein ACFCBU_17440 [Cyanophyceae cyanobacterium]
MKLERLAKIDVRECWQNEANDFTPWLADEENIKLLGDTIGLELEVEAQEDEHRATLDWLNEITDEKFNFFGLEIELWKIGDSAIAPKLNLTCQPNNWSKTIAGETKALNSSDYSEGKRLQLEFWSTFRDFATDRSCHIKVTKARP